MAVFALACRQVPDAEIEDIKKAVHKCLAALVRRRH